MAVASVKPVFSEICDVEGPCFPRGGIGDEQVSAYQRVRCVCVRVLLRLTLFSSEPEHNGPADETDDTQPALHAHAARPGDTFIQHS